MDRLVKSYMARLAFYLRMGPQLSRFNQREIDCQGTSGPATVVLYRW